MASKINGFQSFVEPNLEAIDSEACFLCYLYKIKCGNAKSGFHEKEQQAENVKSIESLYQTRMTPATS